MKANFREQIITCLAIASIIQACNSKVPENKELPTFTLKPADTVFFNSFVDCNMAEAWIGDTFRIFPGKYGEDPLWGDAKDLKFADGGNSIEAFSSDTSDFKVPSMPANVPPGQEGLHGAVWFETVYQDSSDATGKTLYAVYHNENYPSTLPWDEATGTGYRNVNWPEGIKEPGSPAAVCRIGIMKSVDGGRNWENRGIFIEDLQPRMILRPHNTSKTFAGGTGDPSAVRLGDYLYLFYGEYGYPGVFEESTWDPQKEWSGQCVSVARIGIKDLDNPENKAKRWDGNGFNAASDGIGQPVRSLQIPFGNGGGPASSPKAGYHWGPSVSWNTYLDCWVMLLAKATGPSWEGSSIWISFNTNKDLGEGENSQKWSVPALLLDKPGYFLWYPSLQPTDSPEDVSSRHTSMRLGKRARLFVKYIRPEKSEYKSELIIDFERK